MSVPEGQIAGLGRAVQRAPGSYFAQRSSLGEHGHLHCESVSVVIA
jgi:hypothetical protein